MSADEPIELPGLSALRHGPSAAVCVAGHLASWFIEPDTVPAYCKKCGAPVLVACPSCGVALPGDPDMLSWVPYHGNCPHCGKPYPWKADDIARAKRTLAEQAEVEGWGEAVRKRADELVDDLAAARATAAEVLAAVEWLARRGAESARDTIVDAVARIATPTLQQALRAEFPGRF
jgi:hypothetical protein